MCRKHRAPRPAWSVQEGAIPAALGKGAGAGQAHLPLRAAELFAHLKPETLRQLRLEPAAPARGPVLTWKVLTSNLRHWQVSPPACSVTSPPVLCCPQLTSQDNEAAEQQARQDGRIF